MASSHSAPSRPSLSHGAFLRSPPPLVRNYCRHLLYIRSPNSIHPTSVKEVLPNFQHHWLYPRTDSSPAPGWHVTGARPIRESLSISLASHWLWVSATPGTLSRAPPLPHWIELHKIQVLELLRPSYRQSWRETDLSDDGAKSRNAKLKRKRDRDRKERNRDQEKLTGI